MSKANMLSSADVAALMTEKSADTRAQTAQRLGETMTKAGLSDKERHMAEEICRLMMKDVEVKVRAALSQTIRLSPDLPHDLALELSNDVSEVALPFIEMSSVLTDDDLIAIINSKPVEFQVAVAGREAVSERVSDRLVDTGNEDVVARLVSNDGAVLSEKTMTRVLDEFGHVQRISNPMAQRSSLPMGIAERLVNLVSEHIRDHLVTHHQLSADVAMDLLLDTRERATLHLLDGRSDGPDVFELVDQLASNGRLTPTIILRALCMGDHTFFEAALAKRAGIPVANAFQLIHDRGGNGLRRLFKHCGLSDRMVDVARAAIDIAEELQYSQPEDRHEYQKRMLERLLTFFEDDFDGADIDYFIGKITDKPQSTMRH
ncbi:DUF2336 domain-containing protein [Hankyongella ginsenosidimutans]|uniref:DUF2336 domain-containing protein n=1 Tax=Hankyongella ginsenosidimutans TaxID=1763828 RepID=A0A4D7C917_9SPHN|nr:DUF2336 domain-containing protein [Hankyongella ginsenosidimutans]QCI80108.1 DUF2336 domain-containing protein [Hankyongella ginsenosidimutans]